MKKNQVFTATIEDFRLPNRGIATVEDKRVVVHNGLPGQRVEAKVFRKRRGVIEARVTELLEPAPWEQKAQCPHFGPCGGCTWQTMPYEMQLELKGKQVQRLLANAGISEFQWLGISPSPTPWAYRNKMEFTFGDRERGGELTLGLHCKGRFYEILTTDNCQIVDSDFTLALTTVLEYCRREQIPFFHRSSHQGVLRHLVVRKGIKTGQLLLNLVTTSQGELDLEPLVRQLRERNFTGQLVGVLHTINDSKGDVVQSDETRILWGQDHFTEEILGLKFRISPFSFFQTNSLGAEVLYSTVREFAGDTTDKVIFDLYCGTGTIAQVMAPQAKQVFGIELVEEAVEAARTNTALNGLDNCQFIAGDVTEQLDNLAEQPDVIILDPPRSGVNPKAIAKVAQYQAPQILYVSCQPKSLARDLKEFTALGYQVDKVQCVDMFPHTPHVETVCLMSRN
ncbi:MAG: 23S rRNA (uracil(1939)-C(5))-methyltransferase RlmD [Firmicutes bacterium]|nr:23S rRNA (uracil(1939)-C(5))-methyltransferase RlmD [Bacillota bacterium]